MNLHQDKPLDNNRFDFMNLINSFNGSQMMSDSRGGLSMDRGVFRGGHWDMAPLWVARIVYLA